MCYSFGLFFFFASRTGLNVSPCLSNTTATHSDPFLNVVDEFVKTVV
jgi:hypothetical protein